MRAFRNGRPLPTLVGVLLVAWVVLLGFAGSDALALFQQTEDHGSGGGCHCGEKLCGCASAPAGCSLVATCSCPSSGECTQRCTYDCEP